MKRRRCLSGSSARRSGPSKGQASVQSSSDGPWLTGLNMTQRFVMLQARQPQCFGRQRHQRQRCTARCTAATAACAFGARACAGTGHWLLAAAVCGGDAFVRLRAGAHPSAASDSDRLRRAADDGPVRAVEPAAGAHYATAALDAAAAVAARSIGARAGERSECVEPAAAAAAEPPAGVRAAGGSAPLPGPVPVRSCLRGTW